MISGAPSALSGRNFETCTFSHQSMAVSSLWVSRAPDLLAYQTDQPCLVLPISEVNDGTAVDIFSFGMCALEVLATLDIASSPLGSNPSHHV